MPSHPDWPDARGRSWRDPPETAYILDRAAARRVDDLAARRYGMASLVLMENAARASAERAMDMLAGRPEGRVVVVCGPGKNGGDGFAAARHLHNLGGRVAVVVAAEAARLAGDAAANFAVARAMDLPMVAVDPSAVAASAEGAVERVGGVDLIVDALFGTGLDRPVREPGASLIRWMNGRREGGVPVLAIDVPSGLDCDTGKPLGEAVRATATVTFCGPKRGFLELGAQAFVGELLVGDIGVPRELVREVGVAMPMRGTGPGEGASRPEPPDTPGRKSGEAR